MQPLEIVNIFSVTKKFLSIKIIQGKTLKHMMFKESFMEKNWIEI